jgi:hypothetical protein
MQFLMAVVCTQVFDVKSLELNAKVVSHFPSLAHIRTKNNIVQMEAQKCEVALLAPG